MTSSVSQSVDEKRPVVLISGATGRIGRFLALNFTRNGWNVGLHFNTSQSEVAETGSYDRLVDEIRNVGGRVNSFHRDLTSREDIRNLLADCSREPGAPICLINQSAGVHKTSSVMLAGVFGEQIPEDENGNIINIINSSVRNDISGVSSNKVFDQEVRANTQKMAYSLAPRIRVNTVCSGSAPNGGDQAGGRGATPEDIASAVRFILEAPAMTGQIIMLDDAQLHSS